MLFDSQPIYIAKSETPQPSIDQSPCPWADVLAEFEGVIKPIFDAPITMGQEMLDSLGDCYQFKRHQF